MAALDHLLTGKAEELPERFLRQERRGRQAFALVATRPEAARLRDDLAFFQAVAVEWRRTTADGDEGAGGAAEVETALRQVVSEAVVASGVVDLYAAIGMERPDLALLDENFARRAAASPHPNLQIELLRRLLADQVRAITRRNVVLERRFSDLLDRAMKSYNNHSLSAAEVIAELVELAKQLRAEGDRAGTLGLTQDELAFYDAVRQNDSAVLELGDEALKRIARQLVMLVRDSATVDWDKKEQVRAFLRAKVRRLLTKYHYPPDRQEAAVQLVLKQAEAIAAEEAA